MNLQGKWAEPTVQQLGAGAVLQYNTANDNGKASHLEIER